MRQVELYQYGFANSSREHTNDLDLVYGVMGLATSSEMLALDVDYSMAVDELFITIARKAPEWGHLRILTNTPAVEREVGLSTIPSRAPDWCVKHIVLCGIGRLCAATATSPQIVCVDNKSVSIQGTLIDRLKACHEYPGNSTKDFLRWDVVYSYVYKIRTEYEETRGSLIV